MKKIALFLSVILALSLCACGKGEAAVKVENVPTYKTGEDIDINKVKKYENFLELSEEWANYNIGDPYIMKYNGMFYLYVSSPYGSRGIKVWSSRDLLNWENRGIIAADRNSTYTAYSPKVIHHNGTFYLYTTPDGNGLHILTGTSPLGPFMDISGVQHPIERVNGALVPCSCKVHPSIDACIFIDDDGQWYLGHGNSVEGIEYHKMLSPTSIDSEAFYPGTVISGNYGNNWTETGEIFKRDERYFMTYSGNHVANFSYRTNWASSEKVLSEYTLGENPLLASTSGKLMGTGCGLVFEGADLTSDYVVYHNLVNPKVGPIRRLNIDRIAYNGGKLIAYGPTEYNQTAPSLPSFYDYMEKGDNFIGNAKFKDGYAELENSSLITKNTSGDRFTAEFNFIGGNVSLYAAVSGDNKLEINISASGLMTAKTFKNGNITESKSIQLDNYSPSSNHVVKVIKDGTQIKIYIDTMKKITLTDNLMGGTLGYSFSGKGKCGYTAFTNYCYDESIVDFYKPIGGEIAAKSFLRDDFRISGKTEVSSDLFSAAPLSGEAIKLVKGDYARYKINTDSLLNALSLKYKSDSGARVALIDQNNNVLGSIKLPKTDGEFRTEALYSINLKLYHNVTSLYVDSGSLELYEMKFEKQNAVTAKTISTIDENGFTKYDGQWTAVNGIKSYDKKDKEQANLGYGDLGFGNYEYSADIVIDENSVGEAGLLLRVQNIAEITGNAHQIFAYNDQGYYAYISAGGYIGLDKHNFNTNTLQRVAFSFEEGRKYNLKVVANGNLISVYLDNKLKIAYNDYSNPFITGKVGLHSQYASATYTNIKIK